MSECSELEVKDSEEFGRFVIAKRNFQSGELILEEEPLLMYPVGLKGKSSSGQNLLKGSNTSTLDCVGCFKFLKVENVKFCSKCQWPVCCNACAEESLHAKYECSLFAEKKIGVSDEGYAHIYILRAVLMYQDEVNPIPWGQLASLCSTYNLNDDDYLAMRAEKTQTAIQFLKQCFEMNVEPKIIDHIIGSFHVNGFEMSGEDKHCNSYTAGALYSFGSMFSHSCAHNGEWVILAYDYNGIKRWNIRIYARRNILCDEPISISYVQDGFSLGTARRSRLIADRLHFDCKCTRCLDASEFSFHTEALVCPSCSDETFTADEPTDEFSSWTCNHCGICKDYSFAKMCLENFDHNSFIWKCPLRIALDMSSTSTNGNCGLSKYHREIILATVNWIGVNSAEIFEALAQHSIESHEIFISFMETAAKCLTIFRMFGKMVDVADLEFWIAQAIAAYYFKTSNFRSIEFDEYLLEDKLKITTAIYDHLKRACDIVEWNAYNAAYVVLRFELRGHQFWINELNGLKDVCSVDTIDSLEELKEGSVKAKTEISELGSVSNDFKERSTKNYETSSEAKSSPREICDPVTKKPHEEPELSTEALKIEEVSASQSLDLLAPDVILVPEESSLSHLKPRLSLLNNF